MIQVFIDKHFRFTSLLIALFFVFQVIKKLLIDSRTFDDSSVEFDFELSDVMVRGTNYEPPVVTMLK